jgi:poly(3-hydroxybutyrate) depolymerase
MRRALRSFPFPLAILWFLIGVSGNEAKGQTLPAINADPAQTSISGISSGAFMAIQFTVAWSSTIMGVGAIAGGPYYCAEGNMIDFTGSNAMLEAVGPCMKGPPPSLQTAYEETASLAQNGDIDNPSNLRDKKIYLFHGFNDAVVATSVSDAAAAFFRHYAGPGAHNVFYQNTLGAGHSQPILDRANTNQLNACPTNATPFINQCGYDAAGAILQHIYGVLNPRQTGQLTGKMLAFDQRKYTAPFDPDTFSMGRKGFVYVPHACAAGAACRVHIALHGCLQDYGDIKRLYVDYAGYNEWADTNNIVVLYPQTTKGLGVGTEPLNPKACWDWFAYIHQNEDYVTKNGRQIHALKAMLDALTQGSPPHATAWAATPPQGLTQIDAAATAIDLAWRPVHGATSYRVERASGSGDFMPRGTVTGPSFSDSNLSSSTRYRYRIVALRGSDESPPSDDISAGTITAPPPCKEPGSCPILAQP